MGESLNLESVPKAIAYLATLAYLGAVTAAALARSSHGASFFRLCAGVARIAALVGVAALLARAWGHASLVADGVPDRETLARVVLESRWGGRWQWQLAAAVAAVALSLFRGLARGAWFGPRLAALAWVVATPLLGHGASTTWQHLTHAAHLAVAGAWLGTVCVLALASRAGHAALPALGGLIARFSPLALSCAGLAGVSGTLLAVTYVGTFADLGASPYGRWLLLKLFAVGVVGACGFVNWRRTRGGQAPAPGWLQAEALGAVLTAVVTAILTETEHPAG